MKKIIAICLSLVSTIVFLFYASVFLINYNYLYKNFLENVKIDPAIAKVSPIIIKKFPYPYIVISNITEANNIELKNIKITLSLLSILKFNPEIKEVKVSNVKIEGENTSFFNYEKLLGELLNQTSFNKKIFITDLILMNKGMTVLNLKKIKIDQAVISKERTITGEIDEIGSFKGVLLTENNSSNFILDVSGADFDLQLVETYNNNLLDKGKVEINIIKLSNFLSRLLPDTPFITSNMNINEMVKVSFDFYNTSKDLTIENFTIESPFSQAKGQGLISKEEGVKSNGALNFTKIDLKNLETKDKSTNLETSTTKYFPNFLSIFNDKSGEVTITVETLNLNDELFNDIKLGIQLNKGELFLQNFSGIIHSGGSFHLEGKVSQNTYRSTFDGKLFLKHDDLKLLSNNFNIGSISEEKYPFTLSGDITCTLIDFYLSNLLLKTNDTTITGTLARKIIGSTPRVNLLLNISSIDASKKEYPFLTPITSFFTSLTTDMSSSEYLNKFIPLRTLNFLGSFDLTFNDLIYKGLRMGKVNMVFNIAPGLLEVNNLNITNGNNYLSSSWKLITSGIKPTLEVDINDGALETTFLTPSNLLNLRNLIVKDYKFEKVALKINCNSLTLKQEDLKIEKTKFRLENNDNLFKFNNIEGDLLGGALKASGSVLLEPFTYNFVYALYSINLDNLSKLLPAQYLNTGGVASMNGMLTTNGNSLQEQLYNLYIRGEVIAKDIKFKNFAIDDLIKQVRDSDYNIKELDKDAKNALLSGQTQLNNFKAAIELTKGIVSIKEASFKTNISAGAVAANFNIYNFNINLAANFTFYTLGKVAKNMIESNVVTKIGLTILGSIFNPQKNIDIEELRKVLQSKK